MTVTQQSTPEEIFDRFCNAVTFKSILSLHCQLCEIAKLKPTFLPNFYPKLKEKLNSWKPQALWAKFDKRASHRCYLQGKACVNSRVLVIGCGPCGLRSAIEAQLLGAKVVVIEKRDRFSRHNVLHLWPFVIEDLRSLGAKKFFGKFCAGSIDHISIRQLQCILLKVALLLGVEVHENVGFEELIEPPEDQSVRTGWRARFSPEDHPVSQYEFDVLISADGKRNTLQGFPRKELRGRLAIAITANFVNRHTEAENRVEEISGVAFIFNQKFFRELNQATGIDLENIVYYKDETHYFVMTAKKHSLLSKGVIIHDYSDTVRLLSPENVDREALMEYAREAADFSTNQKLPRLEFAVNHYGNPDVAMFDFTSMFAAENASRVIERRGHKLLLQIIGDSLLEPFWPTGSGCARGFLGAFDACWALRSWASGRMTPLEVIAERESIYRLLAQTTPENLHKDHGSYALDPHTRYPNLNTKAVKPHQVRNLYDTDCPANLELPAAQVHQSVEITGTRKRIKRSESMVSPEALMSWLRKQVSQYPHIEITDSTSSFKDGRALCAIVNRYRPDLIDLANISPENGASNCQLAFDVLEELGITPIMSGAEMAQCEHLDRLAMLSYLTQVYDLFRSEIPHVKQPKLDLEEDQEQEIPPVKKAGRSLDVLKSGANTGTNSRRRTAEKGESREGALRIGAERKGDTWRRNKMRRSAEKTLDRRYRRGASDTFNRKVLHLEAKFGTKSNPSSSEVQPQQQQEAPERFPNLKGSRISVMAEKLFSQLATKDDIPKPAFRISNRVAGNLNSSSENCHFCRKRVYLMERMTAEGKTFHRGCFKCEYCSTMLRLGGYGFVRDEDSSGMFFCTAHLSMAYYMRAQLNKKKEDSTNTQVINEEISEKKIATETKTQHKRVMDEEKYLRAGTPERVEFDNSFEILDESGDASVIDEDQWTDHNFGSSIVIDTEESSSEDEEEDADQDARDDVFHDVEVLEALDLPNTGEESQSSGELSFDEDEEGESIPESWEDEELDEDLFNEENEDEDFGENLEVLEQLEPGTLQSVSEASSGENSNDEILQESEEKPLESELTIESGSTLGTNSGTEGRLEVPVNLEPEEDTLNLLGAANHGEVSGNEDPGTCQPNSGTLSAGTEETNFEEIDENDPEVSEPVETENVFVKIPDADLPHEESEEEKLDGFRGKGTGKEIGKDIGELEPVRGEVKGRSGRQFEPSPGFVRKKEVIYKDRERQSDLVRQMVLSKVPYQRTPDKTGSTPSLRDHETVKREARAKAQAMADSDLGLSPPDYIENLREKLRKKDPETPSVSEETPKSSRVNSESEQQNERSSIYLWAGLSPTDCEKKFEMPATLRKDADKKAKNGERRRSIIQTIAGFFGVGSSNEDVSPDKTKNVKQKTPASKERLSIFKLGSSGKTKDKPKADLTDSVSRDRSISSPVSATAEVLDEDANRTRSSSLQCTPLSANVSSVVTPGTKDSEASCSTPRKKQLKQIKQAARQAELKRLRMAQSIQRQLEEVEVKQKMLEEQGVKLEKTLRGENGGLGGKDEASLLQDWFQMVHEKNALARYEQELMVKARQLELEDRYARLQQELGEVKDSPSRNEEAIRTEMKDIDDQLNHLRSQQLQERQRYRDEDKKDLEARMLAKGFKLNSLRPPKDTK